MWSKFYAVRLCMNITHTAKVKAMWFFNSLWSITLERRSFRPSYISVKCITQEMEENKIYLEGTNSIQPCNYFKYVTYTAVFQRVIYLHFNKYYI
jgi:hypothetical protein